MSELDEKLKEKILYHFGYDFDIDAMQDGIAQIKQAFKDEGWHQCDFTDGSEILTGREWYDRFWYEFVKNGDWTSIRFTKSKVIKLAERAAKKAAGLL